jgi:triosephosphate isomerase
MNGSRASASRLLADVVAGARALHDAHDDGNAARCEVAVCPPFPYLAWCASSLDGSPVRVGAQDVSEHDGGAYTGEVSATMLIEAGCRYVLVGHSERRAKYRESDEVVARKAQRALRAGLHPIVCVGETLEERRAGMTHAVLARQVRAVAEALLPSQRLRIAIAYEPVWAVGAGAAATPQVAQDAHAAIRRCLAEYGADCADSVRILYGGSLQPASAPGLLAMPDIDGGLVGGASLDAADFVAIVNAAVPA